MMKKIAILFFIIGFFIKSNAQFPFRQTVSNNSTMYYIRGGTGIDSTLIFAVAYADTANANFGWIKNIPGAVIRTSNDKLWIRNNVVTKWIEIGSGGGGGSSRFGVSGEDDIFTSSRAVNFDAFTLRFKDADNDNYHEWGLDKSAGPYIEYYLENLAASRAIVSTSTPGFWTTATTGHAAGGNAFFWLNSITGSHQIISGSNANDVDFNWRMENTGTASSSYFRWNRGTEHTDNQLIASDSNIYIYSRTNLQGVYRGLGVDSVGQVYIEGILPSSNTAYKIMVRNPSDRHLYESTYSIADLAAQRFGKSGEDVSSSAARSHDMNDNNFAITDAGQIFFEHDDGTNYNYLDINNTYVETLLSSSTGGLDVIFENAVGTTNWRFNATRPGLSTYFEGNASTGFYFNQNAGQFRIDSLLHTTDTTGFYVLVKKRGGTNADMVMTLPFTAIGGGGGGGSPGSPSGSIQYNSGGAFAGSANLTYDAALLTSLSAGLGVTQDDTKGIVLINTTTAALGAQQISPQIRWSGQGWTTSGSASREVEFAADVLPVQQVGSPTGIWRLRSSINGGGYTDNFQFKSDGSLVLNTGTIQNGAGNSISMAGSVVYGQISNAIVFSTNTIDSSSNTFMGGGQNSVIQTNSAGSVSLGTDGRIHRGAPYSLILNDANEAKADATTVGGFSTISAVTNGFAYGDDVSLGVANGFNLDQTNADSYTDSHAIGSSINSTGDRNMTLGMRIDNFGNESIIIGGGFTSGVTRLKNNRAGIIGFGKNSDSLSVIFKSAAGTTGTYGEAEFRGAFRLTNNTYNSGAEIVSLGIDTLTGLVYRKTISGGGGTPAGSDREIQFNNSGAFGASSGFVFNSSGELLINVADQGAYKLQVDGAAKIFGTTSDGSTKMLELHAANGASRMAMWTDGHLTFNNGTATGVATIEVVDEIRPMIIRNSASNAYTQYEIRNDQNVSNRSFDMAYSGSAYAAAFLTSGLTGEQGVIYTSGSYPISFGTNNTQRAQLTSGGEFQFLQQIRLPEIATPSTPASGNGLIYFKSDGHAYALNDGGTETDLQAGGGSGATTALDNLAAVAINTSLLPGTDDAIDLGSASKQWKDLYMTGASIYMAGVKTLSTAGLDLPSGGGIRTRTSAGNTVLLQAYDVDGAAYVTFGTLTANNTPTLNFSTSVTVGGSAITTGGGTATGTNTGDQTSIVGITGSTAQFNTALNDGDFATLAGSETLSGKTLTAPKIANAGFIADANGNELIIFTTTGSAINEVTFNNAATGNNPGWTASGGGTDIGIDWTPKAAGKFRFLATTSGPTELRLFEDADNGTNYGGLIVPSALGGDRTYTFPDASTTIPIFSQTITFTGPSTARTVTFPDAAFTAARTDAAQTFTGSQTFGSTIISNNAITASGNAATVPVTSSLSTVTNNSAATLTITITTASAVDGQVITVRILDATAATQTITWVNTENSSVTAPTTSNGSTTLFLTVRFMYNSATSKWRCIGFA